MNQLKPTVNMAKIQIPTGYEQLQREAMTKRRLAETMLAQGLAPQRMGNWAQVLGKLAQTWAGKSLDKEATAAEAGMQTRLREDYGNARAALAQDVAAGLTPQQIIEKHGGNPLLEKDIDPFRGAYSKQVEAPIDIATAQAKDAGSLTQFGDRMVRKGDVLGTYANAPSSMVHANPDGSMQINPVAATAAGIGQGNLQLAGGPQTTAQIPNVARAMASIQMQQPQAQAPMPQTPAGEAVAAGDVFRLRESLPPQQFAQYFLSPGRAVKLEMGQFPEQLGLPSGTRLILPDGTEGWAP